MISGSIRQRAEWPSFVWDRSRLAPLEDRFLHESGRRVGAWRHLPDQDRTELRIEWLSAEALGTSAIEGEILDRASVQSSIRRQFGLSGDLRGVTPAEAGVAEMKVALCHTFDSPLDHFDQLVAGQLGHRGRSFRLELHRGGPTGDQIVACQQRAVHARRY